MYLTEQANDDNRVSPDDACPKCGQDQSDMLIWIDDDQVRCASCGTVYAPSGVGG